MKTIRIVHVIPLGFERSIVTSPIRKLGGEKVHILSIGSKNANNRDPELYRIQQYFTDAVMDDLTKMGLKVEFHDVDMFDFEAVLKKISEIVVKEKNSGSTVYINISAFGRLVSVAASLAGWYHDCVVYYVEPDRYYENEKEFYEYGRSVCLNPKKMELPKIDIAKLSDKERFTLSFLQENNGRTRTNEILKALNEVFPEFDFDLKNRREYQRAINKLNRLILDKLESKGYIRRIKEGRYNWIHLTKEGRIISVLEADAWKFYNIAYNIKF